MAIGLEDFIDFCSSRLQEQEQVVFKRMPQKLPISVQCWKFRGEVSPFTVALTEKQPSRSNKQMEQKGVPRYLAQGLGAHHLRIILQLC